MLIEVKEELTITVNKHFTDMHCYICKEEIVKENLASVIGHKWVDKWVLICAFCVSEDDLYGKLVNTLPAEGARLYSRQVHCNE